jgi:hypothetical protein
MKALNNQSHSNKRVDKRPVVDFKSSPTNTNGTDTAPKQHTKKI